ncbi:archaeosortase/exosortase family protein [Hydrogenimonas sp.]
MRGFVLRFCLWSPLLFGALYFPFSPLYELNLWQSTITSTALQTLLEWVGLPVIWNGNELLFTNGSYLILTDACNGMAAYLLFAAAVASFPAKGSKKGRWLLIGYAALSFANLVRLVGVSFAMHVDPYAYGWAHDIVGRYGFGLFMLLLYARFVLRDNSRYGGMATAPKATS